MYQNDGLPWIYPCEIWDSVKTALTELIEQDLGKAGKGKQVVEGGPA